MTRASDPEWKVVGITTSDPVWRTLFSHPTRNQCFWTYKNTISDWPKDGAVLLLDPDGKRERKYDPSEKWTRDYTGEDQ